MILTTSPAPKWLFFLKFFFLRLRWASINITSPDQTSRLSASALSLLLPGALTLEWALFTWPRASASSYLFLFVSFLSSQPWLSSLVYWRVLKLSSSVFKKVHFLLVLQQMGARVDGEKQKALLDVFLGGRGIVQTAPGRPMLTLLPLLHSYILPRFSVMWSYSWSGAACARLPILFLNHKTTQCKA